MDSSIQVLEMEMAGRLATLQGAAAENAAELEALTAEKRARLEAIAAAAVADKQAADELEATANGDSTGWLSADELTNATARQPFVVQDIGAVGADELLSLVKQALAANDKPLLWLYRRLVPGAWAQHDVGIIGLTAEYRRLMGAVDVAIVPEHVRTAKVRASELRLAAERRRVEAVKALWELDSGGKPFDPWR